MDAFEIPVHPADISACWWLFRDAGGLSSSIDQAHAVWRAFRHILNVIYIAQRKSPEDCAQGLFIFNSYFFFLACDRSLAATLFCAFVDFGFFRILLACDASFLLVVIMHSFVVTAPRGHPPRR
ncbi:hypothetical protein A5687_14960 [Mycobacterium mantenii]|uniref:Uncharacterized protein n=1 Tax=Mycobacterium mantenii TaxID=560555 RepID=A0A1A2T2Z2_MYCNT|nr:hypothetical protein A5688_12670 [Mycobacterium mantenii]OBH48914.1 hypothetical protein A5687_14960 [Mycobacterium mantenii]OBH70402.1 hypothetical protein A5683_00315 [Mycobacterium mantenii]